MLEHADKNKVSQIGVERDGHKFVIQYSMNTTNPIDLVREISELVTCPDNPLIDEDGFSLVHQVAEYVRLSVFKTLDL